MLYRNGQMVPMFRYDQVRCLRRSWYRFCSCISRATGEENYISLLLYPGGVVTPSLLVAPPAGRGSAASDDADDDRRRRATDPAVGRRPRGARLSPTCGASCAGWTRERAGPGQDKLNTTLKNSHYAPRHPVDASVHHTHTTVAIGKSAPPPEYTRLFTSLCLFACGCYNA